MSGEKLWYLKCKVGHHLHRGMVVMKSPGVFQTPIAGEFECPDNPGQTGQYSLEDWIALNDDELREYLADHR